MVTLLVQMHYSCQTCGKGFSRQSELRKHVYNEHDPDAEARPAEACPECSFRCSSKSVLTQWGLSTQICAQ